MGNKKEHEEEAKIKGLRLAYKQIPMEVFDKRAVSKNEVVFHDVAYIEFKPIFKVELPFNVNCGGVESSTIIVLVTESAEFPELSLTL